MRDFSAALVMPKDAGNGKTKLRQLLFGSSAQEADFDHPGLPAMHPQATLSGPQLLKAHPAAEWASPWWSEAQLPPPHWGSANKKLKNKK